MSSIESLWVCQEGAQAGFCAEEDGAASVFRAGEVGCVSVVEDPAAKRHEALGPNSEQFALVGHLTILLLHAAGSLGLLEARSLLRLLCLLKSAYDSHAIMLEYLFLVRGVGQLRGEVLPGKMELFMQVRSPSRAIGYIIDKAAIRDVLSRPSFSAVASQFKR